MSLFGSVITAMVTPFSEKGEVDLDEACRLANYLLDNGSDMILLAGTTGESPTLTHTEEEALFRAVVGAVKGKGRVMAGAGSNCTKTAVKASCVAKNCGVDALLQVVPYYNKPNQEGLYQHFKAVSHASDLPIMLYNIPGRTGINLEVETVSRLTEFSNIVAIKEAAGSVDQVKKLFACVPENFDIYSGDDALTLSFLKQGAKGVVSVASHCAGNDIKLMLKSALADDDERALNLHQRLLPLFEVLFMTSNPIVVKAAMELMGFKVGNPRLPLIPASNEQILAVKKVLINLDIIKC